MGSGNRTSGRGERHVCVWQKWQGFWQYYLLVLSWASLNSTVLWSPFLERPGNFSGLKVNFKIKTCWIVAQFPAHKPVKNYWNFVRKCNTANIKQLSGPKTLPGLSRNRSQLFLQKDLLKGRWCLANFFFSNIIIVTLLTHGLPSSFFCRPIA